MEKDKDGFSVENYLKELEKLGPYPAGISPAGIFRRQCREFYEDSGLENLLEKASVYASTPLARSIMSAFL